MKRLFFVLVVLLAPGDSRSDAVIRSEAMNASTIAEFFVTEQRVVVELEIGLADLEAFQLLLPDEIYEQMGNSPQPRPERLTRFFEEVLPIVPGRGSALRGQVVEIGPRPRVRRDPITGAPLPNAEDETPESVVVCAPRVPVAEAAPGPSLRSTSGRQRWIRRVPRGHIRGERLPLPDSFADAPPGLVGSVVQPLRAPQSAPASTSLR